MIKIFALLALLSLVACSPEEQSETNDSNTHSNPGTFIKAAHYFGDTWPITFWQEFELDKVDDDLMQIKSDGFNTIVLAVPWRGFETEFKQASTTSNPLMYQRLHFLLEKITAHNLKYMLRLGYAYDFSDSSNIKRVKLCTSLYKVNQTQNWLTYLKNIQEVTNNFEANLVDIFVSWEDFWCPHDVFPHLDEAQRNTLSHEIGYSQWKAEHSTAASNLIESQISIPTKNDFSYADYLQFIDEKFNTLILFPARTLFPNASMEVRTDKALIQQASGGANWVGHDLHLNDSQRASYWAPFWGARNEGEKLTAKETLHNFKRFLTATTDNGQSTSQIIEQFNFYDNTPHFSNNANILDGEIKVFLPQAAPLLKQYSIGYGVWAYRDYVDNALYNASFELDLSGWREDGMVSIIKNNQDHQLSMQANSSVSQYFEPQARFMNLNQSETLEFQIVASSPGSINLYVDDSLIKSRVMTS